MTTCWKAVRLDGTDFRTGTVRWLPPVGEPLPEGGLVVTHPTARRAEKGASAAYYLSVATTPTDCTGMYWPCRLARVERTRAAVWTPNPKHLPRKRASWQWRVVEEVDPALALGPQGVHVAALIERAGLLTDDEAQRLDATWYAAWDAAGVAAWHAAWDAAGDAAGDAARDAAWDAAGDAAWDAARDAAGHAAGDAACALVVRDLIPSKHYDALTRPWRTTVGPIHPDDADLVLAVREADSDDTARTPIPGIRGEQS